MEALEEKELKKFIHPEKGVIIALNHEKTQPTSYYRLHPNAEIPYSLEDVQHRTLKQTRIHNTGLLRSLNYPQQRPNQAQVPIK